MTDSILRLQGRRDLKRCLLVFATGLAPLFHVACEAPPPEWRPTGDEVTAAFGVRRVVAPVANPRPPLNLYMDASASMQGFVHDSGSKYCSVVQSILLGIQTGQYALSTFKISPGFEKVTNAYNEALSSNFYHGGDTPISALLEHAAVDLKAGKIVVIVSDMVQSEPGKTPADVVDSLVHALKAAKSAVGHPEVLLLGFRSAFNGTFYVETLPKTSFSATILEGTGRPFYILVFAPSPEALDNLQRLVLGGLKEQERFMATRAPLVPRKITLAAPDDGPRVWQQLASATLPGGVSPVSDFTSFLFEVQPPQGQASDLQWRYENELIMSLQSLSQASVDMERVTFPRRGSHGSKTRAQVQASLTATGKQHDGSQFVVEYKGFPRPAAGTWDVYRLAMRAGTGNLLQPDWVDKWNTGSDQSKDAVDKTLNLNLLVRALLRGLTDDVVFSESFVALGRGL